MAWCKRDVSDFFRWNFFSFKSAWIFACAFQLSRKTFFCIVFWLKCSCSALLCSLCTLQYFVFVFLRNKVQTRQKNTVLCKSNANDNRRISRFVLAIYRRYISETSHGLPNVKTINHRDIGTIFAISPRDIGTIVAISPRDIVLARLCCNDISQSRTIYHHDISLQQSSL